MTQRERTGFVFALAEILAVGFVPAFCKYAVEEFDPLLYSAAAVSVAAVVAAAFAAARGELRDIFRPGLLVWLLPIAWLGTTATTLLLLFGAKLTDGVSTALLLQVEPVYSLVLTIVLHRRRAPAAQITGTALILAGIVLVLYDGSLRVGLGGVLILLAPLGWQASHVLALRVMPPLGPYALTAARYLYGGAALVLMQAVIGRAPVASLGGKGLAMCLFHGAVLLFCGTLFWYETIRRLELSRATAIVTPWEPILSLVAVWAVLAGLPNRWQLAGVALVLPGLWMIVRSGGGAERPDPHEAGGRARTPAAGTSPSEAERAKQEDAVIGQPLP